MYLFGGEERLLEEKVMGFMAQLSQAHGEGRRDALLGLRSSLLPSGSGSGSGGSGTGGAAERMVRCIPGLFSFVRRSQEVGKGGLMEEDEEDDVVQMAIELIKDSVSTNLSQQQMQSVVKTIFKAENSCIGLMIQISAPSRKEKKRGMWVRISALQLIHVLHSIQPQAAEEMILANPNAMYSIVELLNEPGEDIRNETVQLLCALARSNKQIQDFMAFSDGFSKLIEIATDVRGTNPMIGRDCLSLMNILLSNDNNLAKKQFVLLDCTRFLPSLLSLSTAMNPGTLQMIFEALKIVCNLMIPLLPENDGYPFSNVSVPEAIQPFLKRSPISEKEGDRAELEKRRRVELRKTQENLGLLLENLSILLLCVSDTDEAFSSDASSSSDLDLIMLGPNIRILSAYLTGVLVFENERNALLLEEQIRIPIEQMSAAAELTAIDNFLQNESRPGIFQNSSSSHHHGHRQKQFSAITALILKYLCSAHYRVSRGNNVVSHQERSVLAFSCACIFFRTQRLQIHLIGHAIAPIPSQMDSHVANGNGLLHSSQSEDENDEQPRGSLELVLYVLVQYMEIGLAIPNEVFVDTAKVTHVTNILAQACHIMQSLILKGNPTAKEISLRLDIPTDGEVLPFFSVLLRTLQTALALFVTNTSQKQQDDAAVSVVGLLRSTILSILRILCEWLFECPVACKALIQSPANIFIFRLDEQISDVDILGMTTLLVGLCVCGLEQVSKSDGTNLPKVALGLIEKGMGLDRFSDRLRKFERSGSISKVGRKRNEGEDLFDNEFARFCEQYARIVQDSVIRVYSETHDVLQIDQKTQIKQNNDISTVGAQVIAQYQQIIRSQDAEIEDLKRRLASASTVGATANTNESSENETKDALNQYKRELEQTKAKVGQLEARLQATSQVYASSSENGNASNLLFLLASHELEKSALIEAIQQTLGAEAGNALVTKALSQARSLISALSRKT